MCYPAGVPMILNQRDPMQILQTADKVVSMAFDIARANAELLSSEASAQDQAEGTSASQSLEQQQTFQPNDWAIYRYAK